MTPTRVGRSVAWLLVLATAVVVLVPMQRHVRGESIDLLPLASILEPAPSFEAWNHRSLAAIDAFESEARTSAPLIEPLIPHLRWLLVRNGGIGNETVYVGPGAASGVGWLMLRSGYDHLLGPGFLDEATLEARRRAQPAWKGPLTPDPRPAILDLHDQLAARRIELVVVPVPVKPAIHPEPFGALIDAERVLENPSMALFLDTLRDHRNHVLDIAPELRRLAVSGTPAYLRTDSHWSPPAVDLVAQRLASVIEPMLATDATEPPAAPWTRFPAQRQGRGDLWPSLDVARQRPIYDAETVSVEEVSSADGRLWQPSTEAAVLLLGDSFSQVYSEPSMRWGRGAGLAEQLAFHLERPVDRMAVAGGADRAVRDMLADDPDHLANTRVVIYQFAARELTIGDWPLIALDAGVESRQ